MVDLPHDSTGSSSSAAMPSRVVLVVAESESIAKRIESFLRNAGHPIRCAWVTDLEDTEEALRGRAPDLLLCAAELPQAPFKDVLELARRLAPDLPVILLSSHFVPEDTVVALAAGAADHVSHEDLHHLRHLELVLLREFSRHQNLRDLRATRKRLDGYESRHQQLLQVTNDAVAHVQEGIVCDANPAFAALLGYQHSQDLHGIPLMDLVASDHIPKVKDHLKLLLRGKHDGKPMECCLQHREGNRRVSVSVRLNLSEADGEQLIEMLIRSEHSAAPMVAERRQPNFGRGAFFEALAAAIAAANQRPGMHRAALLLVVDDMAGNEERLGLQDAEQAMARLMEWTQAQLIDGDRLFRFSTGEIAALVSREDAGQTLALGEKLVHDVAQQVFSTANHEAHLSLSVAAYPFSGSEQASTIVAELVREVRQLSTKGGRQFANIGPTAKHSQLEREELRKVALVRQALVDNRLKLAYQSIASLEGDTRQHFDVLVRVLDEDGHEIHASEFIDAAERHDLMRDIDRWVTARTLRVQAKRDGAQDISSLFVKLSENTIRDAEGYLAFLAEQLKARALKPGELVIQAREAVLEKHVRKARMLTQALMRSGAQVAIEHFGVGSNSAQLIEHLPVQFLKFHYSFTKNFGDKDTQKKMTTLMELAKQKNIKIIVSHVEDANVMARLWQMGVNFIQGYHVQEPEVVLLSADVGR